MHVIKNPNEHIYNVYPNVNLPTPPKRVRVYHSIRRPDEKTRAIIYNTGDTAVAIKKKTLTSPDYQ